MNAKTLLQNIAVARTISYMITLWSHLECSLKYDTYKFARGILTGVAENILSIVVSVCLTGLLTGSYKVTLDFN